MKLLLDKGAEAKVAFTITKAQLTTVQKNGSRQITGGAYKIYVGGHQPNDPNGDKVSNVLEKSVNIPHAWQ